jgi:hypothetical protein
MTHKPLFFVCLFVSQVMVVSNYHFLADPTHWHGGLYTQADNRAIMMNLVASSVAHRSPRTHQTS